MAKTPRSTGFGAAVSTALALVLPLLYLGALLGRDVEAQVRQGVEESIIAERESYRERLIFVERWCHERYAPYELCKGIER